MEKVTEEFAAGCFKTGIDCSQIVFGHCAGKLGLDEKQAILYSRFPTAFTLKNHLLWEKFEIQCPKQKS